MKVHELKIEDKYFSGVVSGHKTAEIRKNDRDYKVGDVLYLREILKRKSIKDEIKYTGLYALVQITDILTSEEFSGLANGYAMLSFAPLIQAKNSIHDCSYYSVCKCKDSITKEIERK